MRYCSSCILPDTRPGLTFGEDGVCSACRAHGVKQTEVDWDARAARFAELVERVRERGAPYDCLLPVSGGKDSTWQTLKCLEAGLHPLAVTWKTPGRTELGQRNLDNLVELGVDHLDFQINPVVERRFMLKAFERFGIDRAAHAHGHLLRAAAGGRALGRAAGGVGREHRHRVPRRVAHRHLVHAGP